MICPIEITSICHHLVVQAVIITSLAEAIAVLSTVGCIFCTRELEESTSAGLLHGLRESFRTGGSQRPLTDRRADCMASSK